MPVHATTFCDSFDDAVDESYWSDGAGPCSDATEDCDEGVRWGLSDCSGTDIESLDTNGDNYDVNLTCANCPGGSEGNYSVRFYIPDSNCRVSGKQRSELDGAGCAASEPNAVNPGGAGDTGKVIWEGFDVFIPSDAPNAQDYNIIHQYGIGGTTSCGYSSLSPVMDISIVNGAWDATVRRCDEAAPSSPYSEAVTIVFNGDDGDLVDEKGNWVSIVIEWYPRIVSDGDGYFKVYKNGTLVVDYSSADTLSQVAAAEPDGGGFEGGTAYGQSSSDDTIGYRKLGIYNAANGCTEPCELFIDSYRRKLAEDGGDFDAVAGRWGPDVPTVSAPAQGATGVDTYPTITSPNYYGPRAHYQTTYQVDAVSNGDTDCSGADWTGLAIDETTAQAGELLTKNSWPSQLSDSSYYCVRVRHGIDVNGSASWGGWSENTVDSQYDGNYFATGTGGGDPGLSGNTVGLGGSKTATMGGSKTLNLISE